MFKRNVFLEGAKKKHSLHVLFEIEKMLWFVQKSSLPPIPKHVKFPMYFLRVDPCQISTLNWGGRCKFTYMYLFLFLSLSLSHAIYCWGTLKGLVKPSKGAREWKNYFDLVFLIFLLTVWRIWMCFSLKPSLSQGESSLNISARWGLPFRRS